HSAQTLVVGAVSSQADFDTLVKGRASLVPGAILKEHAERNGRTPEQEEELWRKRQMQLLVLAAYEREMEEIRERTDRLMERLDEQERACRRRLAAADARAIVLHDGRRVLVDGKSGYIDEATGDALEGDDKAEAQRLRKNNSETVAERHGLTDRLKKID